MRKSIVAIMAVAIIGALGVYNGSHKTNASTAVQGASATGSTVASSNTGSSATTSQTTSGTYKDGTYTGASEDTPYGTVQIAVVVNGGKIVDVKFLRMPNDRSYSQEVTSVAGPLLKQSTLKKQSANIDFVSGASSTSAGYQQSLQAALDKAI